MVKVAKGLPANWGVCSRTALLGSYTLTLSHHNNNIAVGSDPGDIIILNAITGSQSAVLSGHTSEVTCVVFSTEGTSLVSGSHDVTVKFWDIQTGGVVKTFFGHESGVSSVSISVDSTTIASGSYDRTICLWSVQTGECYLTIQRQEYVPYVMFSPKDPQHLISVSNHMLWQWGDSGSQIRPPFDGWHVDFSSDGAQFVSCFKKTITVRNYSSGVIVTEFQAAESTHQCCFSPDNSLIATAADKTVYCWDISTSEPQLVETFVGHTGWITSLIFSSSTTLVSASTDNSVKFWQVGTQSADPPTFDPKPTPQPSAPIKSITLQPKEGIAITSDLGNVIKVWDISTGVCKTIFQTPAKGSHKKDAQLVNGRVVFVWYVDKKIHVWDAENEELLWEVDIPWRGVEDLRISGDSSRIFGLHAPFIWAWSLQTGEVVGKLEIDYYGSFGSLIVDGSKVWAHWPESKYKGWDFGIPSSTPVELLNIPGSNRFRDPKQAGIKNPATGEIVFQLSGRFSSPVNVQCDGSYLVAGYQSGEVLILDLINLK